MFLIAAYPQLYENYVFSRFPELPRYISSESDHQGAENFFFLFS